VSETGKTPPKPQPDTQDSIQARWLSPRRLRFWLVLLLLSYTLTGFFLVPVVLQKWVTDKARDDFGREASFTRVQFNPFVMKLRLEGFQLDDTDGVKLAGFDEFLVDFEVSSLFRWALTFKLIKLDGFYLLLERFELDDTRLSRLLSDAAAASPRSDTGQKNKGGLPRMLIHDLTLSRGSVAFTDHVPESPVKLTAGPVDISIQALNTLPDRDGQQSVVIKLPGDATLRWQGNIDLAPLSSEGRLTIENTPLYDTAAYLQAMLPLESFAATLSLDTKYKLSTLADGGLDVDLDDLGLTVADISASGLTPAGEFLSLASLAVEGGSLRYPENTLSFAGVKLTDPAITAWLDEQGRLNLLDLVPPPSEKNPTQTPTQSTSRGWKLDITEFLVEGGLFSITDQGTSPPAAFGVTGLNLDVTGISNESGRSMPVKLTGALIAGGNVEFDGAVIALPELSVTGQASAKDIELSMAQPYAKKMLNIEIEGGTLSSQSDLSLQTGGALGLTGNIVVDNLKVQDTRLDEQLLGWKNLNIDRFELDVPDKRIGLSRVMFDQLYGRFRIAEDRSTNISGLAIEPDDATKSPGQTETQAKPAWSVVIGGIDVNQGSMDFSDLSLPLPFQTLISSMEGTVSTIDLGSVEPANIRLEGQVNEYGLARIEGTMSVLDPVNHTDISVEFRNLLMSNLSPYSAQFAGREIDEGRLNLKLGYFIEQGQLKGQNKLVLSDLALGAKVDSPDAVSLPLDLAIGLLKDSDGVIDIDLPIEGDINDPEFQIGGVIMKAFTGLISKIISAPFRLLGSLIGIDSEDLGQFQFLAGRSDLAPPELEKTAQLQQALAQRPELRIEIQGPYDPVLDTPKLQYFRLRDQVIARLGEGASDQDDKIAMLDEDIRSTLEDIFSQRFPEVALEDLKTVHTTAPADNPEGKPELDELAYSADLRDRLLAAETISQQDLENLAKQRADSIRDAFLASGEFDENRIVIGAPQAATSQGGEWVVTELGVATD
jgi:hypothetical protein